MEIEKVNQAIEYSNELNKQIEELVDDVVNPICTDLDRYVGIVNSIIQKDNIPDRDLEAVVLNLSAILYYVSAQREKIGLKSSMCVIIYKDVFNRARALATGTVQDKTTAAQLQAQSQEIANVIYDSAYNIIKNKEEKGECLLSAVKKVLSRRISELQLSQLGGNR